MKHQEYQEMLPLYGLDVLEEAELRALKEHFTSCTGCRIEVDEWNNTTSMLAYAAARAEPSGELKSRILANVRSHNTQPSTQKEGVRSYGERTNLASQSVAAGSNLVRMPVRSRKFQQKLLALAASIAFVALVASLLVVWSRNRLLEVEVSRLSRGLDTAQSKLSRLEQDSEILNAPTLTVATLKGTPIAQKAQGKLMYDPKTGHAIFTASNLPAAPAGMAYQLWYLAGKRAMPGAVFSIDASGSATLRDQLPPEARGAKAFAVTLEPAAGVGAPTGEMYLLTPTP